MRTKYHILLQILDKIREEARGTRWETKYAVDFTDSDQIAAARSKAYIHLYLKVMFGVSEFSEREKFVTDGGYDGGIDGFYIDKDTKRIFLLQSKFRNTEQNFEGKKIQYDELLSMDVDRITRGQTHDGAGNKYNGKIQGIIRMISELPDIARYNYHVAIIANCDITTANIRRLTDGFPAEVFDYSRAYNDLVFPILSGTYFKANDITIQLDLNNKSAGAKTSYSVITPSYECEITVLFVPVLEVAKVMDKYRNSVLEYNPRSYLDLEGKSVNASIRETLLRPGSNEFALMNNGLTILSDETNLNERIGQHNKAQLRLLNPQIINGGQTAYTLSRAFNEDKGAAELRFKGKEVLVKVITLTPKDPLANNATERRRLIDEISAATNRQTIVLTADRFSNECVHIDLQRLLFDRFGLLYERKRGEFSDGVFAHYINRSQVLDRALFMRLLLTVYGRFKRAIQKKIFIVHGLSNSELTNVEMLDRFNIGYKLFQLIAPRSTNSQKKFREALAKVYIGVSMISDAGITIADAHDHIDGAWTALLESASQRRGQYTSTLVDRITGEARKVFNPDKWMKSADFEGDLTLFVAEQSTLDPPWGMGARPLVTHPGRSMVSGN